MPSLSGHARIAAATRRTLAARASAAVLFVLFGAACLVTTDAAAGENPSLAEKTEGRRNVIAVVPRSWPPHYGLDANGKPIGFAIDVMNEIADRAGLTITYKVANTFPEAAGILLRGEADLIPNSGIIPARMDKFAFTAPIETIAVSLFVRQSNITIKNVSDLVGRTLAVARSNAGYHMFKNRTDIDVQVFADVRAAIFPLLAGHVDALVYSRSVVLKLAEEIGVADRIKIIGKPLREIRRGIRVRKDNTALLAVLDPVVKSFVVSPAYHRIYTKWYGSPKPYWTIGGLAWVTGAILACVLLGMGWWRYRSVVRLNQILEQETDERKAVERSLRESEIRASSITKNAADGIVTIDELGRIESFNPAAEAMFGYGAEEMIGENVRVLMTGPDAAAHDGHLSNYHETGIGRIIDVGPRELSGRRKDGSTFPMELAVNEMHLGDRRLYVGDIRDITERKRIEREASEKSAVLDTALQIMAQGLVVYDSDQKIVACNEKFIELSGLPAGCRALGMSHEEILRLRAKEGRTGEPLTEEVIQRRLARHRRGDASRSVVEHERSDGTAFIYHNVPLPGGGFVGTYTDITQQKQAEEKFRQAQKMEAVGQLTGGVAHDFNNLLAIIQGNAELLATDATEKQADLTRPILRAVARGAELTQRLLAFSRKQPLVPKPIDMNALVAGMRDLLVRSLGETIEISISTPDDVWQALADKGQVENALLNLANNARDAMPEGGRLTIKCSNARLDEDYRFAAAGEYVELTVSDTGTGMTTEVIAHAFEPFFTTKDVGKGSGLGLSMVHGFAEQSGGHVKIDSVEGGGTTVRLFLPRAAGQVARRAGAAVDTDVSRGEGEHVLVIEDDEEVRSLTVNMLESLGYRVSDVADAIGAHEVLDEQVRIDLVLSDVVLPGGVSGPQFAMKVRESNPDLKIIFMSGYPAEIANGKEPREAKLTLLDKPFSLQELSEAVRHALD